MVAPKLAAKFAIAGGTLSRFTCTSMFIGIAAALERDVNGLGGNEGNDNTPRIGGRYSARITLPNDQRGTCKPILLAVSSTILTNGPAPDTYEIESRPGIQTPAPYWCRGKRCADSERRGYGIRVGGLVNRVRVRVRVRVRS
jgi:hypothetical protein